MQDFRLRGGSIARFIEFIYLKVIWSSLPTNANKGHFHLEIVQELLKNHTSHIAKVAFLLHFCLQIFSRNAHFPIFLALLATKILKYIGQKCIFWGAAHRLFGLVSMPQLVS